MPRVRHTGRPSPHPNSLDCQTDETEACQDHIQKRELRTDLHPLNGENDKKANQNIAAMLIVKEQLLDLGIKDTAWLWQLPLRNARPTEPAPTKTRSDQPAANHDCA